METSNGRKKNQIKGAENGSISKRKNLAPIFKKIYRDINFKILKVKNTFFYLLGSLKL